VFGTPVPEQKGAMLMLRAGSPEQKAAIAVFGTPEFVPGAWKLDLCSELNALQILPTL
jgi:hypothetical protein